MTQVSIVIPCYNYGRFLREAVESSISQTWREKEVCVVDDGSTDSTGEVLRELDPSVLVLRVANGGVARARNLGARETSGEWLCFLDGDDGLEPGRLERCREVLGRTRAAAIICGWRDVDDDGAPLADAIPHPIGSGLDYLLANRSFPVHCALVRRSAFAAAGGFFEGEMGPSWPEDTDLWFRLAAMSGGFEFVPEVLCRFRRHSRTVSRSERIRESQVGFRQMIARLGGLLRDVVPADGLRKYHVLVETSFACRYLRRGDLAAARETLRYVWELCEKSSTWIAVAEEWTARHGGQDDAVVEGWTGALAYVPGSGRKPALVAMEIALAERAAARGDVEKARRRALSAALRSPRLAMAPEARSQLVRAVIGPEAVWTLRRLRESLRPG